MKKVAASCVFSALLILFFSKPIYSQEYKLGKGLMLSVAGAIRKELLSFFSQDAIEEAWTNTLYSFGFFCHQPINTWLIRHRFEIGINHNNEHSDFNYVALGWLPELCFKNNFAHATIGAGPSFKNTETEGNGGFFLWQINAALGFSLGPFSWEFFIRHSSNGYTAIPNHGTDYFGISFLVRLQ